MNLDDNLQKRTSDDPSELDIEVSTSVFEFEELLEQKLDNVPKGENSLKQWKKDCNNLVEEINTIYGYNKYKKV